MVIKWYVAFVVAVFAAVTAHSRLFVAHRHRTPFRGNFIEALKDHSGSSHRLEQTVDAAGTPIFIMHTLVRPTTPSAIPGKPGAPPKHRHNWQDETFEVHSGVIGYYVDGKEGIVKAGEPPVTFLAGTVHTYWNAGNDTHLVVKITVSPAHNANEFFRTIFGLSAEYGGLDKVSPFQLLATFAAADIALADLPKPVWWSVQKLLVPYFVTPVLGIKPFYPEYTNQ